MLRRIVAGLLLAALSGVSQAAPSCMPGLYGTQVGNAGYARTEQGWYGYFYCRDATGRVTAPVFACVHGSCLPLGTFVDKVTTMKMGPNPIDTLRAAWDASFDDTCLFATGDLKTVCEAGLAAARLNFPQDALPPAPPAPEVWEIAPATSVTRPSRKVVNGALVTMTAPVYLAVGTACAPAVTPTFVTTAGTWMAVAGQPTDLRWLCKKR